MVYWSSEEQNYWVFFPDGRFSVSRCVNKFLTLSEAKAYCEVTVKLCQS